MKKHAKAARWVKRDSKVLSPSYTRAYPLVARRGRGAIVEDIDGNTYIDMNAGVAVLSTGHCHPLVSSAIGAQAKRLIHYSGTDFYYRPQIELAEKLSRITPGKRVKKVFFSNSGTEAVECAIKIVRWHTRKRGLLAYDHSFHGRTMGSLTLTHSKPVQWEGFGPLVPGAKHVPYPYCYRCPARKKVDTCKCECIKPLKKAVQTKKYPALFFEPIQGEGGYVVPPDKYYDELKRLKRRYGFILVADEIQSGFGRSGKMFACEHWNLKPEIMCLAKGIASGMPLGATVAQEKYMRWPPGSHASTFGGNPVSCVAALATLEVFKKEKLVANAAKLGKLVSKRTEEMKDTHRLVGDARGKGLMQAIEIVSDKKKTPGVKERKKIVNTAFENGVLFLPCGKSTIRISPPLVIKKQELEQGLDILDDALAAA